MVPLRGCIVLAGPWALLASCIAAQSVFNQEGSEVAHGASLFDAALPKGLKRCVRQGDRDSSGASCSSG